MDEEPNTEAREADLVERHRRGDPSAFDELVAEHRRAVYAVARGILGSHEDADEAAQETFVRAWRALGRFRGESVLRTWLIRIVLNVARSMKSRQGKEKALEAAAAIPDPGASAEETAERRETASRIRDAVWALPRRQREVVMLKVFAGMTYVEVAAAMDVSEGAVKAHLHQAVSRLRRQFSLAEPPRGKR